MSREKVTRTDVARVAGTSVAVVSYVVNNGPRPVAEATRARVLAAIESTGYRPDGIARALASGSTRTFGLIVPNIANPFVAALAHAIEGAAYRRGFTLLLGDSADDPAREADLVGTFLQHRIDGLLFYGVDRDHPWLDQAVGKVPVVVLDEPPAGPGIIGVRVDERAASASATRHLIEHGRDAVAIITGPLAQQNARDRRDGWRDALGDAARADLQIEGTYTRGGGYLAGRALLERDTRPDAVFASNEQQALGVLAAAAELEVRVPEDLAVICFNGTTNAEYSIPALSTIEQPIEEIAALAIDLLTRSDRAEYPVTVCDVELVRRRSCGCEYRRTPSARALLGAAGSAGSAGEHGAAEQPVVAQPAAAQPAAERPTTEQATAGKTAAERPRSRTGTSA
ncbi:LacI family DNA-binding transcriptional regulator [Mycetocola saprophilus]|uniref:LacI family DNA-binding transcriptional regulator n=1 Tax=Mycetocola saprophilus TaxID=76636 RepID=UPI0009DDB70D|nr:LacI family DNA-binding transcriptional regulator [Mycetocola saprophilus]